MCTHTDTHTEAHSRFYILKRIFLATLKIGISAQHWRQAIFYRPRKKMGWETVPAETHGQNQNGNRSEARRRSSLGLSVLCECVFAVVLRFYYLPNIDKRQWQQLLLPSAPSLRLCCWSWREYACISCASIHKFMCLSDIWDTSRACQIWEENKEGARSRGRGGGGTSLGSEQRLCM